MWFRRMAMEKESVEEYGYDVIEYNFGESSIPDQSISDLHIDVDIDRMPLRYGPHRGQPELRALIAEQFDGLSSDNILVTNGASEALFIVAASLLQPDEEILVETPNYASNYEVPCSLGCNVKELPLTFEEGYSFDLNKFKQLMTSETKLVSITHPNNPTGSMISKETLKAVLEHVEPYDCHVVLDETYRDLTFGTKLPTAASLSAKAISVSTLSKSYGVPGIRIGWLAIQDDSLLDSFLATKEPINICNSIVDEHIALSLIKKKEEILKEGITHVQRNFEELQHWMNRQADLEYIKPDGGAVCFPRIKREANVKLSMFYKVLREKYHTFVGPGHWFERSDRHFRIGFGWPTKENLKNGLENITNALHDAKKAP